MNLKKACISASSTDFPLTPAYTSCRILFLNFSSKIFTYFSKTAEKQNRFFASYIYSQIWVFNKQQYKKLKLRMWVLWFGVGGGMKSMYKSNESTIFFTKKFHIKRVLSYLSHKLFHKVSCSWPAFCLHNLQPSSKDAQFHPE